MVLKDILLGKIFLYLVIPKLDIVRIKKKVISEPVKLDQEYRNFDFESPWEGTKYIKDKDKKNDD